MCSILKVSLTNKYQRMELVHRLATLWKPIQSLLSSAKDRSAPDPLLVGSVKTNIGRLEPAGGFAAIIKVVLAFEKGRIPPSINFKSPNSKLNLDAMHMRV